MAAQSVSSVSQLLHSGGCYYVTRRPPPPSPSLVKNGLFLVDFVGFYCKSNRTRRKFGASVNRSGLLHQSVARRGTMSSSVKVVLDLERAEVAFDESRGRSDSETKVADLKDILSERGACGVGFIANLDNKASHQIVEDALTALGCMEHRGGCGADNDSGDGSGVMTSIPWDLFNNWANSQGISTFDKLHTGVGMVFLPTDDDLVKEVKKGSFKHPRI